jgi:hypothetical protein
MIEVGGMLGAEGFMPRPGGAQDRIPNLRRVAQLPASTAQRWASVPWRDARASGGAASVQDTTKHNARDVTVRISRPGLRLRRAGSCRVDSGPRGLNSLTPTI